jgi:O-antigen/teichoic acid export membrane protein
MFLTEQAVGLYNASYKIFLILLTIIQGLSYAMMPMLLKNVKQSGKSNTGKLSIIFYSFIFAGSILGALTFIFSYKIINLMFGSDYADSIAVLKWFSITLFLWPFVMFTGLLLLALNQFGKLLTLSIISMISSIILSIVLINGFALNGSAMVLPAVAVISSVTGLILSHRQVFYKGSMIH